MYIEHRFNKGKIQGKKIKNLKIIVAKLEKQEIARVIYSFHVLRCFKLVLYNSVCAIPLACAKLEFARVP